MQYFSGYVLSELHPHIKVLVQYLLGSICFDYDYFIKNIT